ncbi:helix-turn-helix transcriptional regulator [Curtobacterium sp. MCLR17_007]|uniref:helix-turn-helix transcriptional regulator n=1 Tax=unclassified Curtobacterium TaxID=257496 RepID=UPI0006FD89DE|nr:MULTISPECIES: helix-turn-helix transcriptional regulator [unclassified Curtobacterium]KQS06110.1 XRE family transcriptional regulator [Curtobacterium sp. Leaf183]WIB60485.1 helix-turn-helix transcriptional regulator [Curtobacterium sp. MCLR17_007]
MDHSEFGSTLRRLRDHVAPSSVGVPIGPRRRATGLRREELAGLAGISADYLTRLEQGRATSPSAQVVEALVRALRVADAERELLYALAGHAAPGADVVPTRIPPSVQRLLDRLADTPVAVLDAAGNLLVANLPYDALMGPIGALRGHDRNTVWRHLVGSGSRAVHTPAEQGAFEERVVADLRSTAARYPLDRQLQQLVRDLRAASPRFVALWESAAPAPTDHPTRQKTIHHPTVGPIQVDCDTLVVGPEDLRIMAYTAEPGTADAERLSLAIVLGTQALVE